MMAGEVHSIVVATLVASTPAGGVLSSGDVFRHATPLNHTSGARAFDLIPQQGPAPSGPSLRGIGTVGGNASAGADERMVVFRLAIFYPRQEYVRALNDAGRIWDTLVAIPGGPLNTGSQIKLVTLVDVPWLGWRDPVTDGNFLGIVSQYDVTVKYDGRPL